MLTQNGFLVTVALTALATVLVVIRKDSKGQLEREEARAKEAWTKLLEEEKRKFLNHPIPTIPDLFPG